jgi:hypothetical protein
MLNYVHLSCCCTGLCGQLGVVVQVVQTDCGYVLLVCETSTGFSAASQYLVDGVQGSTGFLKSTTRIVLNIAPMLMLVRVVLGAGAHSTAWPVTDCCSRQE